MALDDDTLRRLLAARTPGEWEMRPRMWEDEEYYVEVRGAPPGYLGCRYHNVGGTWEPVADAQLWAAAPALAAEVLRLRAERDVLRHERDEHAHKAGEWEESHGIELARAEMVEAAARAHLAAADALTLARRTDAADVPAAEARTLAARECLAGLVGYVAGDACGGTGEVPP